MSSIVFAVDSACNAAILTAVLPVEARSVEDDFRLDHTDLARLDDESLTVENAKLTVALAFGDRGHWRWGWLIERARRVEAEQRRRVRGTAPPSR